MADNLNDLFTKYGLQEDPTASQPEGAATGFNSTPTSAYDEPDKPYRYQGDEAPTYEDAQRIAESKYNVSSHNALMGTLVSAGVEIGAGIGGTVYATRMATNLKWIKRANTVKTVAVAGMVAPELGSTIGGAIAFGATEAAIWGFSNFLGQTTRKGMGIQDHYSGGEMIAAAVFGTAAATATTSKLLQLGPSLQSMKAWKSMPIARETGKAFVTGAGLGLAESLLRQEVQLVLNERENRDVMDYMFSGAAGGTFNTIFSVMGRTGAWGLMKAGDSAQQARVLAEEGLAKARLIKSKRKRIKEVAKWEEAVQHLKETETGFRGAEHAERQLRENTPEPEHIENPSGDPRQAPKLEPLEDPTIPKDNPEANPAPTRTKEQVEEELKGARKEWDDKTGWDEDGNLLDDSSELKKVQDLTQELKTLEPELELPTLYRGVRGDVDPLEVRIGEDGEPYGLFFSTRKEVANSYLDDLGEEADGIIVNGVKESDIIDVEVNDGYFSKTEFDDLVNANPSKIIRAKDAIDTGPHANKERDPDALYSHTSDIYGTKNNEFFKKQGDTPEVDTPALKEVEEMTYKELQAEAKELGIKRNGKKQALAEEIKAKRATEEPEAPENVKEPEPEEPKTTERRALIESYAERFKALKGEQDLALKFAPLQTDTQNLKGTLTKELEWKTEELTSRYQKGEELNPESIDELIELIDDARLLNETDNVLKTTAGRGVQANRADAANYVSSTELSLRAIKEDAALFDMHESLLNLKQGKEAPALENQMEMFLTSKETTNKMNAAIYGKEELSDKDLEELGLTAEEVEIQRKSTTLIQSGLKSLERELEKERAKMMGGMKQGMNKHQKDKLAEEVEKRLKENPTIRMKQEQIKYYKAAEKELKDLRKANEELARLAEIEGVGNMTNLRKETEVKDRVAEASTELSKVKTKIAESKARMRQKLKDIDKAQEEINNPVTFAEKRVTKLEAELKKLQDIRSGERAPDSPKTPDAAKTDKELDLEARIKFYKDEVREIGQLEKKELELARLVNLEADGRLGQIRDEFTTKPKIVGEPSGKMVELNKKIADSKNRMRSKLKDIDRARAEMDKFDFFLSLQAHSLRNIEADSGSKMVQFGRDLRAARKLALIDQLPSIMAGVPTGVGLALRSAVRPFAMAPIDFARYGADQGLALFNAEMSGLATTIMNWNGTLTSMGRTFQRGASATDQVMSKYLEESSHKAIRMGNQPTISRAMKTAEARAKKARDPMDTILDFKNNGGWALLSLGVRGIGAVDDGFRRQIMRGRLETAARRKAILEHPNNPELAEKTYQSYMKTMWKDQDGLQVLNDYKAFMNDVNDINQNLLFAAQHDNPDLFHQNAGERLIAGLGKAAKGDNAISYLVDAFMPYISVPIRGVYRGARFAAAPAQGMYAASPANPYTRKLKGHQREVDLAQTGLLKAKEGSPEHQHMIDTIKQRTEEMEVLKERRTSYNEDAIVDTAFGVGLAGLGMATAMSGEATGSLNWMSDDQKEKNKLKPFHFYGMDYAAAAPWSIPIALGADIAQYLAAREAGVLDDNQNLLFMLSATVVDLTEQVPMSQGIKTFNSILSGGMETKANLLGRLAAGYVPIPAQFRKTLMAMDEDGTIGDMRGGTFEQRAAYAFFGVKPVNKKTGYFGEDLQSGKTWMQQAIIRQAPSEKKPLNDFERIVASDAFDNIQSTPSSLGHRMKMTSFIDNDGVTLQYAYALKLRDHRKMYKGKKRTLRQAVDELISSKKWQNKYEKATISKSLQHTNEGLRELNTLMQDYYFDVRSDIVDDDSFTQRFVNNRDENLYDLVRRKDTEILGNTTPIRELLQSF